MSMKWAYGVTTVPSRVRELLPATLISLARTGFPEPRLFVDGAESRDNRWDSFGLEVTLRTPKVLVVGNWFLSASELFIRQPNADRYALFQDDIVAVKHLREYLEACPYPSNGYLNLCTLGSNLIHGQGKKGWYPSNQLGRGALGLVFDRRTFIKLLHSPMWQGKIEDERFYPNGKLSGIKRGQVSVDGTIIEAMRMEGILEYVHGPSLIGHCAGKLGESSIHPKKASDPIPFGGENLDPLSLIQG